MWHEFSAVAFQTIPGSPDDAQNFVKTFYFTFSTC